MFDWPGLGSISLFLGPVATGTGPDLPSSAQSHLPTSPKGWELLEGRSLN